MLNKFLGMSTFVSKPRNKTALTCPTSGTGLGPLCRPCVRPWNSGVCGEEHYLRHSADAAPSQSCARHCVLSYENI